MLHLSAQGPFYRLFVWCGRKGGCGRCASRCRAPQAFKVRPTGCSDVSISFSPCIPLNPFHEENYVIAWRAGTRPDRGEPRWHEQDFHRYNDCEEISGSRLKVFVGQLPEYAEARFRICAVNAWGRSTWS